VLAHIQKWYSDLDGKSPELIEPLHPAEKDLCKVSGGLHGDLSLIELSPVT